MRVAIGRRFALGTAAMAALAIAAAACGGSGGGGGGGGGGSHQVTLDGSGFSADAGDWAYFRIVQGPNVAWCSSAAIGGGSPSFSFVSPATLGSNVMYNGELFVDVTTNGVYNHPQDPSWKINIGKVSATTGDTLTLDESAAQGPITWKNNKGCPGK